MRQLGKHLKNKIQDLSFKKQDLVIWNLELWE